MGPIPLAKLSLKPKTKISGKWGQFSGLGVKKGSSIPQPGGPSAGRLGGDGLEFCKWPLLSGEGGLARPDHAAMLFLDKNTAGGPGPHRDLDPVAKEVMASVRGPEFADSFSSIKELVGGPSQNSLAILSHPLFLDPSEKEVATLVGQGSGSRVVGMVAGECCNVCAKSPFPYG